MYNIHFNYFSIIDYIGILLLNMMILQYAVHLQKNMRIKERIRRAEYNAYNESRYRMIDSKNKMWYTLICYIVMCVLSIQIIEYNLSILWMFPIIIVMIFIYSILGGKTRVIQAVQCSAYVGGTMLLAVLSMEFIIRYGLFQMSYYDRLYVLCLVIVYFIIWIAASNISLEKLKMLSVKEIGAFGVILAISIVIIISSKEMCRGIYDHYLIANILSVMLINVVMFLVLLHMNDKRVAEAEQLRKQKQIEGQKDYLEQILTVDEQVRRMRHDLKNQMNVVSSLLVEAEGSSASRAKAVLQQYEKKIAEIEEMVHTDNEVVNSIINSKIFTCHEKHIEIVTTVHKSMKQISDIDVCSILGNILDNAIEAEEKLPEDERYIELSIVQQDDILDLFVKNRIKSSVLTANKALHTTKSDKRMHGLGTRIVNDIVCKYGGSMDIYEEEGYFCCDIRI